MDQPQIKDELNDNLNKKAFKKKTLRRLILDPPEEELEDPENEDVVQKSEELSRILMFERGDITSRSLAFVKIKKKKIYKN